MKAEKLICSPKQLLLFSNVAFVSGSVSDDTAITGWAAEALTVSCDGDNLEFGEDNRKRPTLVARCVHSGLSLWWSGVSGGCRVTRPFILSLSLSLLLHSFFSLSLSV